MPAERIRKRGPKPERVKTDDTFDDVIQRALKKKPLRPIDGGSEDVGEEQKTPSSGDKSEK
ncbi:MAG: hypothetical protein IH910_07680 [Proteobacteria bacterium]|nr:hypothetical protein [Pseudomonadota bacterium]